MDYLKLLNERNLNNKYAGLLGMTILDISEGYAKGKLVVNPELYNPIGSIHGGCLFSLADSIGGAAAYSHGKPITTVSGSINYLRAAIDTKEIIAIAKEVKYGKRIMVYDVELFDDQGELLAKCSFTYYSLD